MTTNLIARRLARRMWENDGEPAGEPVTVAANLLWYERRAAEAVKALEALGYSVLTHEQLTELQQRRAKHRAGPVASQAPLFDKHV
jgi:hypothetical protein